MKKLKWNFLNLILLWPQIDAAIFYFIAAMAFFLILLWVFPKENSLSSAENRKVAKLYKKKRENGKTNRNKKIKIKANGESQPCVNLFFLFLQENVTW